MKKFYVLLVACCLTISTATAQKIKKNEVDKFSGNEIVETSNETLYTVQILMASNVTNMFSFNIRRVNGKYSMPATIVMNSIVKYEEDDGIQFLLDNDEVITLKTNYTGIGGKRYENMGYLFSTSFLLSDSDVEQLKNHKVKTVRVNYLGGHYDRDLKPKKQELIKKSLMLFDKL